jgi:hypothetical protein
MKSRLAIDGGTPVRAERLRGGFHGSALIDEREVQAVLDVLHKRRLFRFLGSGEQGSEAARVEEFYKARLGRRYALAVNAGRPPWWPPCTASTRTGDEVISPPTPL